MDIAEMVKVLEGRANKAEIDVFDHWMAESEAHRQEFRQVRQLWLMAQGPWPAPTNRQPLTRIHQLMKKRYRRKRYLKGFIVLAGVLIFSMATWFLWPPTVASKHSGENLAFNHASLEEVAVQLEKKFSIQIHITGAGLETCLFTGSFSKASTLNEIMHAISLSLSVSVVEMRSGYEWKGTGC